MHNHSQHHNLLIDENEFEGWNLELLCLVISMLPYCHHLVKNSQIRNCAADDAGGNFSYFILRFLGFWTGFKEFMKRL